MASCASKCSPSNGFYQVSLPQAVRSTPTCYIFSCPFDIDTAAPPFHALVPFTPNREPGLILVSSSGVIRFWDSIGIGLAGGNHYYTTTLNLPPGQQVTNFIRSDVSVDEYTAYTDLVLSSQRLTLFQLRGAVYTASI